MQPVLIVSEESKSSRSPAKPFQIPEGEPTVVLKGKRAVVVEDEGITQLQIQKILQKQGVTVVGTASNGPAAIEVVLRTQPDFVLMDIRMPIMDGLEASRRILETTSLCIILLTAFSEEEYRREAQAIGTSGYVIKPVTTETLIPQIVAALQKFPRQ